MSVALGACSREHALDKKGDSVRILGYIIFGLGVWVALAGMLLPISGWRTLIVGLVVMGLSAFIANKRWIKAAAGIIFAIGAAILAFTFASHVIPCASRLPMSLC